jgi:hypothetical protein
MKIAKRRGMKRAIVTVARRMAVVIHRIWVDGTEFLGQCLAPRTASMASTSMLPLLYSWPRR